MRTFLRQIKSRYLLSLHQPLRGVDTTDGGALDRAFRARLVHHFRLSAKAFRCWSVCHWSMTGWYTTHRYGIGETVEFGWHPSHAYLVGRARKAVVFSLGGRLGSLAAHNPRTSLRVRGSTASVSLSGWAFDVDARSTSVSVGVSRDGRTVLHTRAAGSSTAANKRYHLTGRHGLAVRVPATPGRHRICVGYVNIGAGTANPRRCAYVVVPKPAPAATAPASAPATSNAPATSAPATPNAPATSAPATSNAPVAPPTSSTGSAPAPSSTPASSAAAASG